MRLNAATVIFWVMVLGVYPGITFVGGYWLGLKQGYAGYFYVEAEDTQIMPARGK